MIIRDAAASDRARYLEMTQEFYSGEATLHEPNLEFAGRTFAECMSRSPYARLLMLEHEEKPAGFALLALTWSNESGGLVAWLEEVYIREEFRGLRLGSQFMEWLLREYQDATRLRLEISRGNDGARRLYERYGFQPLDYEQMVLDHDAASGPASN